MLHSARGPVKTFVTPTEPVQGIKRDCKALPLTVRQMIVQQVQLQAIKWREEARALWILLPCPYSSRPADSTCCISDSCNFLLLMCHFQSVWLQGSLHGLTL